MHPLRLSAAPIFLVLTGTAVLSVSACKTAESGAQGQADTSASAREAPPARPVDLSKPMPPGLDESVMDTSVDPCTDFYRYACGGWLSSTQIPADRPSWSRGFYALGERNDKLLNDILASTLEGNAPKGTPYAKQLADYYGTCMDEPKLEQALPAFQKELAVVGRVKDAKSLSAALGWMHRRGLAPVFGFHSAPDMKNPKEVIGQFEQGGLGLPDRDYYLSEDAKQQRIRENYRAHVAKMFEHTGHTTQAAAKAAEQVMTVETALAKASLSRVELRDPTRLYNRLDRKGLVARAPALAWDRFFSEVGAPKVTALNVTHPPFVEELSRLATSLPAETWRAYLTWVFLRESTAALPRRLQEEQFRFKSANLTGAKEDLPRWKKCVTFTDEALGEALAVPFVAQYFGVEAKDVTNAMVKEIEHAFEANLARSTWMDAETQERARKKLHSIVNKVGYPDKWRKYDALQTDRTSFLANVLRAAQLESDRDVRKIGKPLDRSEWLMSPPTVNAYYDPQLNEIVFPAGILQPPFYDLRATDPVNFGAMGMIVGHEITHGFDDEGRQFDWDGSLRDWWTESSAKGFLERAECVKKRYDSESAIDEVKVNGALTLGENIADLGGLKLSHLAMKSWQARKAAAERAPSYRYDDDQQFFIGFAQAWCSKYRPEHARVLAKVDPHAPPFLRVNVPLSYLEGFQQAFGCREGAPMVKAKAERCEVW